MPRPDLLIATLVAFSAIPPSATAEVDTDIPLGVEAVTGARSGYVYRGFDLAGSLADFQLETEISLSDSVFVNTGGWLASALGDDFTEVALFTDIRRVMNPFYTIGASATYHDFDDSPFRDGFDLGAFLTMFPADDWDVTFGAYRDITAEAWYANAETGWSHRLSDDAYLGFLAGLSWVDDYYGRNGLNDFYGRASFTYTVNPNLSLTPFLGWSVEIEDADGDEVFGGLWFEVLF